MKRFQNILVVVDCDVDVHVALSQAMELAEQNGAKLRIVDVVRDFAWLERIASSHRREVQERLTAEKKQVLNDLAGSALKRRLDVQTKVLIGNASTEIIREVLRSGHDLVMKDAKGEGWLKGFFGVSGTQLLRKCPCPVWLMKPAKQGRDHHVLAVVDASCTDETHARLNRKILDLAQSLCQWQGRQLEVVQAWTVFGKDVLERHMKHEEFRDLIERSQAEARECLDELLRPYKLSHESENAHLLNGDASLVIPQFAQSDQIDVIVMGTVARGGVAGALMGNTAETLVERVKCSILAVKPDDFVSPISVND